MKLDDMVDDDLVDYEALSKHEIKEIETTREWLMRITSEDCSEELLYVPSQLSKLGVAPIDVADRLDWLRDHGNVDSRAKSPAVVRGSASVMTLEKPREKTEMPASTAEEDSVDTLSASVEATSPPPRADLPGPEDWDASWESIEKDLEESLRILLTPEPGLHEFNKLACSSLKHPTKKTRGKRARTSGRTIA